MPETLQDSSMMSAAPGFSPPKVSVILTCFNLGKYLEEAVDSVLAQTCQDFELLIVDDGSTDSETCALLSDFRRPRTRVMRIDHRGVAGARNVGLAHATGDYLCIFDADDRLDPTFFAKALAAVETNPSLTFVSAWLRTFGDEIRDWTPERCDLPTLLWEDTVLTASLVRRDAVIAVGGFDEAMPVQGDDDWELWLMLAERGYRGIILPEILFHYRRRPGSVSTICWHGSGHMPLARYRLAKHEETYRRFLFDVFLHQDDETAAFLRRNDELERHITKELEPAVTMRRAELATLQSRLAASSSVERSLEDSGDRGDSARAARLAELEAVLHATSAEVAALRTSMSWRVTAPLRTVYGWWLRCRGSRGPR